MGTNLATLAEFKVHKSIGTTNTQEDPLIEELLSSASEYIKEYCQRSLIDNFDEEIVEYYPGSDRSRVYVKEYPIVDMVVAFSADGGQTYTDGILYTDYFLDDDYITSGTSYALYDPEISHRAIRLTYTGGFEEVPRDLVQATIELAEYFRTKQYNPKSSLGTNMVERSNKDTDLTILPDHIYRILSNYRTIAV